MIDKNKWDASLLLTTNVFFKLIHKAYVSDEISFLSEEFIKICEEKITDKNIFEKMVECVYETIKDFYKDTVVKEVIGDNLPKFLKGTIETNEKIKDILNDKIESAIEDMP